MADIMCDCEDSTVFKAGYHILARWEQPFYTSRLIINNHLNNCLDNDVNENTPFPGGLV